uniref:5-formyltetrahydrofolate cyclo-ligase n=1 Tax=Strigamia maritima TaxID=126957 RepID=T1JDZ7_STRMM
MQAAKATLRTQIKAKLIQLTDSDVNTQTNNVITKLFQDPLFVSSQKISVYLNMKHEIGTMAVIKYIFENNKECFIPKYTVGSSVMEMVPLYSLDDFHNLPMTKWKIKQPSSEDKRPDALALGGLDVIITPGVAFTMDGKRLGHGRGYYDSYLRRCHSMSYKPYVIGLSFKEQIVHDIPTSDWDVMMDKVYVG